MWCVIVRELGIQDLEIAALGWIRRTSFSNFSRLTLFPKTLSNSPCQNAFSSSSYFQDWRPNLCRCHWSVRSCNSYQSGRERTWAQHPANHQCWIEVCLSWFSGVADVANPSSRRIGFPRQDDPVVKKNWVWRKELLEDGRTVLWGKSMLPCTCFKTSLPLEEPLT